MAEINKISSAYFEDAKRLEAMRTVCLAFLLGLLITALLLDGRIIFILSIVTVLLQLVSWYLFIEINRITKHAHSTQRIEMLYSIHRIPSLRNELSDYYARLSAYAKKWLDREALNIRSQEYLTDEINSLTRFADMIQENAYWNCNLYRVCFEHSLLISILTTTLIASSIPFSLIISDQSVSIMVTKLALVVISAPNVIELIERSMLWKRGSYEMDILDKRMEGAGELGPEELLQLFSNYQSIKTFTPVVPRRFYKKNSERLNTGWAIKLAGIRSTRGNLRSQLECCIKIISGALQAQKYNGVSPEALRS